MRFISHPCSNQYPVLSHTCRVFFSLSMGSLFPFPLCGCCPLCLQFNESNVTFIGRKEKDTRNGVTKLNRTFAYYSITLSGQRKCEEKIQIKFSVNKTIAFFFEKRNILASQSHQIILHYL